MWNIGASAIVCSWRIIMSRVNKTKNRLMEVWNDLDEAYKRMETACRNVTWQ